jgi:glycosyltransferase involved in cell wall biosynthesis
VIRIGVLLTHPVQYYAPLFRELSSRPGIDLHVYFAHRPTAEEQGEGFGVAFQWDVDLTGGYEHSFLENRARGPGGGFRGFDTPGVATAIEQASYDGFIVFGWHAKSYWQAMRACWRTRTPVYVRGDSQLSRTDRGVRGLVKSTAYPLFVGRFAACLATGTRSEEYFRHYGAKRIERSPHFVDNALFASAAEAIGRDAARASYGIAVGRTVFTFAGKLVDRKRPLDLIEAAGRAGGDIHLLFAGDGALREACERRCSELRIDATFAGFLNQREIGRAYAATDALVLPSNDRETWGLVVNEAMACARAAIVSESVGCSPDLVIDGVTGFSYPEGDIEALSARLLELRGGEARAAELGANARRHVDAYTATAAADGVVRALSVPEKARR